MFFQFCEIHLHQSLNIILSMHVHCWQIENNFCLISEYSLIKFVNIGNVLNMKIREEYFLFTLVIYFLC